MRQKRKLEPELELQPEVAAQLQAAYDCNSSGLLPPVTQLGVCPEDAERWLTSKRPKANLGAGSDVIDLTDPLAEGSGSPQGPFRQQQAALQPPPPSTQIPVGGAASGTASYTASEAMTPSCSNNASTARLAPEGAPDAPGAAAAAVDSGARLPHQPIQQQQVQPGTQQPCAQLSGPSQAQSPPSSSDRPAARSPTTATACTGGDAHMVGGDGEEDAAAEGSRPASEPGGAGPSATPPAATPGLLHSSAASVGGKASRPIDLSKLQVTLKLWA